MKKYISILILCLCMGMQYVAFAASPCSTGFALGYAVALRDYVMGKEKCKDAGLSGPCNDEIFWAFNSTTRNLEREFNACCCANGYVECRN